MVFLAGPKSTVLGAIKLQLANIGTNLVWSTYKPESTWSEYEVRVPCFGIEFILKNANGIHWTASESGFCGGPTRIDKKPVVGHHLKLYQTLIPLLLEKPNIMLRDISTGSRLQTYQSQFLISNDFDLPEVRTHDLPSLEQMLWPINLVLMWPIKKYN